MRLSIWTSLLLLALGGLLCAALTLVLPDVTNSDFAKVAAGVLVLPGVSACVAGFVGVVSWAMVALHDASHSGAEVRQAAAEAAQREQQAAQERLRRWAYEDELGIDIDHDGYIGDPARPRTNRYQPARVVGDFPIYQPQGPQARAAEAVATFVKTAWAYSEQQGHDPRKKAVGLARSNWVDEQAGPTSRERQRYDAILQVLTAAPLRLVVDRNPGCGRFAVDLEEALRTLRSYWQYVNVPAILLDGDPPAQPSQAAQAAERGT